MRIRIFSVCLCIVSILSLFACAECVHVSDNKWHLRVAATCYLGGIYTSKCIICGAEMLKITPALGHISGDWEIVEEATCTKDGVKCKYCKRCGAIIEEEVISAKHTTGEWETVKEATCTENGLKEKHCTVCGEVLENETILATGHTEGEWKIVEEATCTENGLKEKHCMVCGEILESETIPATGHTEGEWEIVEEATCAKDGLKEKHCMVCGEILESETIPATGHTEGDWKVVKYPTCTEEGLSYLYCSKCGEVINSKTISALGHNFENHICTRCGTADASLESLPFVNNSNGYQLQLINTTVLSGGSYNLKEGLMGYRVSCIQKYLGETPYRYGKWTSATTSLVKAFQKDNGLEITGEVDLTTWLKIGFTEEQWKTWDCYVHPSEITVGMTRSQIIDKFIEIAYTYLGGEYIYGCAGSVEQGGDCSGFVLSCLYGIGINPEGYDSQQHNFNEYNSRLMWADEHFKLVDISDIQVGDLVFYQNSNGIVIHVAIYIGDGRCIESWPAINILSLYKNSMYIKGVKRVLYY